MGGVDIGHRRAATPPWPAGPDWSITRFGWDHPRTPIHDGHLYTHFVMIWLSIALAHMDSNCPFRLESLIQSHPTNFSYWGFDWQNLWQHHPLQSADPQKAHPCAERRILSPRVVLIGRVVASVRVSTNTIQILSFGSGSPGCK